MTFTLTLAKLTPGMTIRKAGRYFVGDGNGGRRRYNWEAVGKVERADSRNAQLLGADGQPLPEHGRGTWALSATFEIKCAGCTRVADRIVDGEPRCLAYARHRATSQPTEDAPTPTQEPTTPAVSGTHTADLRVRHNGTADLTIAPVHRTSAPAHQPPRDALAPRVVHQCAPVAPVRTIATPAAPAPQGTPVAPVHCPGAPVVIAPGHDELHYGPLPRTGRVVRTWLTPRVLHRSLLRTVAPGERWYDVSVDGTGEIIGCRPDQLAAIAGTAADAPVDGDVLPFPVIYEAEYELAPGRWQHVAADWSTAGGYDPADLRELAERIARHLAADADRRVRVSVQRPGHPETYEYAESLPPARTRAA